MTVAIDIMVGWAALSIPAAVGMGKLLKHRALPR